VTCEVTFSPNDFKTDLKPVWCPGCGDFAVLNSVYRALSDLGCAPHDTVIVSDRIRENMRKMRRETLATVMNLSINETLSRTLITSGTAVLVTAALFLLGGPVIHSFAFTLLVGFIVGTYSSIYVASPIVLYLEKRQVKRR